MKASQFVDLLRKVVREEVKSVVKEELKSFKRTLVNEGIEPTKTNPIIKKSRPQPPANRKPMVSFNGPLADILNETARSMQHNVVEEEWPEMNGRSYQAEDAPLVGMQSMMSMMDTDSDYSLTPSRQAAMSGDPTAAFVKDYSKLLQKADAIAQNTRG
jgi:hypothetical protein